MTLRSRVAWVISLLSILPNIVMVLVFLLPALLRGDIAASWWRIALWLLLVVGVSIAVSVVLSQQLFRPLTNLTYQIKMLRQRLEQSGGQAGLDVEVAKSAPPEISALATAFNALLHQVGLEQHKRRSFMAMLMHDMKTPLIASNNVLTLLQATNDIPPDERAILLGELKEENHTLLEMLQKMVEAHRFERESIALQKERHNLKVVVQRACARVRSLAHERGINVTIRGHAYASVDARELERALYNIIGNGVRYAKHSITIEIYPNLLRISDDGPGLPAPLEQLAQPFNNQPVDIAGKRYTAGTGGLGLFIARRILELHGGRLVTESSSTRGTVFLAYLSAG